ncbi:MULTISPECIES: NAD(P)-binding domain-containing protein, partial [unclassified Streptomyces]|uniref:NAD(P)-binding domain-containing protein n=1 Tax=unclassified Streptomyces TaxID=2593676 RepID=UPI0003808707
GHSVTVWNRTARRAHDLAGDSITPTRTAGEAVRSSHLVIACLATYEATLQVLESATDWHGTTLVVLGSGTPGQAAQAQQWATERGAAYLDGVILCHPQDIGTPEAALLYSGPPDTWAEHQQTLMSLANTSHHVSDQASAANLLDVGLAGGFFITALAAYAEAATYVLRNGIPATVVDDLTDLAIEVLRNDTKTVTKAITTGRHETDQATLTTHAEGARVALAVLREDGYRGHVLAAAIDNMTEAEQAGLGHLGFSAQAEVVGDGA